MFRLLVILDIINLHAQIDIYNQMESFSQYTKLKSALIRQLSFILYTPVTP